MCFTKTIKFKTPTLAKKLFYTSTANDEFKSKALNKMGCKKAKEDLVFYKVLLIFKSTVSKKDNSEVYKDLRGPFTGHPWVVGKLERAEFELNMEDPKYSHRSLMDSKITVPVTIDEGLHAYLSLSYARRRRLFSGKRHRIFRVVVPKGTRFVTNSKEVVAEAMILLPGKGYSCD